MKSKIKNLTVYVPCTILLAFVLLLFFNLKTSTSNMIRDLNSISPYIENENWETSKEMLDDFYNKHKNKIEMFSVILRNDEIDKALMCILEIFLNIELKDKPSCLNKIENLKFYISNFYISQIPNIKNIF